MTTAVLPPTRAADDERVRLVAEIGWIRALLGGERGPRPEPSEALRDVASRLRMSPFGVAQPQRICPMPVLQDNKKPT